MFNQQVAGEICRELAEGKSLRSICAQDGKPAESTVRAWALDDIEGFAAQYTRAREIGYERLADEILEISDDGANDTYLTESGEATNHDVIARSRLRVDSRKWMLSKMLPKKYGEKIETTHTGAIDHSLTVTFVSQ